MQRREQLYEGKAKRVYAMDDPNIVIVSYKDDATAFDGISAVWRKPIWKCSAAS